MGASSSCGPVLVSITTHMIWAGQSIEIIGTVTALTIVFVLRNRQVHPSGRGAKR